MRRAFLTLFISLVAFAAEDKHVTLAVGSPAPDFALPGVDGKTHKLAEYSVSPFLAIVFTCNHCPTAQLYEDRIKRLAADYRGKGVALVAIQPNDPNALRVDEMVMSDMSDSLAEMKIRAEYRKFNFPFLYDGDTQSVAMQYGPVATPHVFIFDKDRKLRYQGRIDNSPRNATDKVQDARNAIEALLAGKPVAVEKTPSVGCSTKWAYKEASAQQEEAQITQMPITLDPVTPEQLKTLRANQSGKLLLINFWATWCGPCTDEFPKLE